MKKVLPLFLVLITGFLGLNFFIPSFTLIKTAEAQVPVIINDLTIDSTSQYTNKNGDYRISFILGTAPIPPSGNITIIFPPGFTFQGTMVSSSLPADQLSCSPQPSSRKATCTVPTDSPVPGVAGETGITIYIDSVKNPSNPSPPDYIIDVDTSTGGSDGASIEIIEPPPGPPPADFPPDFGKCTWRIYDCLISLGLYIPKIVAVLLIIIIEALIKYFVLALIIIGDTLLTFGINLNKLFNTSGPTSDALLSSAYTGYEITLGFTNIGFIIAIIAIAFATILRRESFAIKAALPRLIVIAILINFALFFAVSIIQFSNNVGDGLYRITSGDKYEDSLGKKDAKKFSSFFSDNDIGPNFDVASLPNYGGFGSILNDLINGLVGAIVSLIFGIIFFFGLVATAVMMLIRYIFLNFLMIILPLALLSNIFPKLSVPGAGSPWKDWTKSFTGWVIFYPAVMFFLAIATLMMKTNPTSGVATSTIGGFGNILMIAGVLIGGLMVSQKLKLAGAAGSNMAAGWATKKMGGLAGRGLRGAGAGIGLATTDTSRFRRRATSRGIDAPPGTADFFNRMDQEAPTRLAPNLANEPKGVPSPIYDKYTGEQILPPLGSVSDSQRQTTTEEPRPSVESGLQQPTQTNINDSMNNEIPPQEDETITEEAARRGAKNRLEARNRAKKEAEKKAENDARKKYENRVNRLTSSIMGEMVFVKGEGYHREGGLTGEGGRLEKWRKDWVGVKKAGRDFKAASKWGKAGMIAKGIGKATLAPIKLAGVGMEAAGGKLVKKSDNAGSIKDITKRVLKKELKPENSVFGELFYDKNKKTTKDELFEEIEKEVRKEAEEKAKAEPKPKEGGEGKEDK